LLYGLSYVAPTELGAYLFWLCYKHVVPDGTEKTEKIMQAQTGLKRTDSNVAEYE